MTHTKPVIDQYRVAAVVIRKAMEDNGIKQSQIANDLGISPGYVSDILSGRRGVSATIAQRIADATGANADLLHALMGRLPPRVDEPLGEYIKRVDSALRLAENVARDHQD